MSPDVVAFDVDGTLTVRDCVVPFMRRICGTTGLAMAGGRYGGELLRGRTSRDRDDVKESFVRSVFSGRVESEVGDAGVLFAAEAVKGSMRLDVAERLRWHQEQGHVVVLVSASLGPYLHPFGDLLEVDAVLCTELEASEGRFTGEIAGRNCRGPEKASRLASWMEQSGFATSALTHAYGDSDGDREMLAMARLGLNVRREEITRAP